MNKNDLVMIYCKHICKCHNEFPLYNYYMLIKRKKNPHKMTETKLRYIKMCCFKQHPFFLKHIRVKKHVSILTF
jgi:hypothetical protein